VGCKSRGHSSKDPLCLTYQRKVDEINSKYPENLMPYYPTHEPWTHALLPPQTQPYYAPPPNSRTDATNPTNLCQSTINRHFPTGPTNTNQGAARIYQGNPTRHPPQQTSSPATTSNAIPMPPIKSRHQNATTQSDEQHLPSRLLPSQPQLQNSDDRPTTSDIATQPTTPTRL
jgi:hypothetical protein